MQVKLEFPDPHSKKQEFIMKAFQWKGLLEIWVANGTKYGKSVAAGTATCSAAPVTPQGLFRWIAPIYSQANVGYKYCQRLLPGEPYTKKNDSSMELKFPHNNCTIQFFHGTNPESLEGEATQGNVLDEAAKMKEQVYSSVKTTTTVTRGPILAISTPRGKNWFYRKCMEAKEEMLRAKHEGRSPTKIFITAPSSDNPLVSPATLEDARRSLPARLYRQYYEAKFEDDGSVFAGFRDCLEGDPLDLFGERQTWVHPEAKQCTVVIGADWAKTTDYTVFTAIDLKTKRVVAFDRFHQKKYTEAIRQLVLFSRLFKDVSVVFHDKTGVGMAIDDQMSHTELTFEGITFSNASKAEMVNRLITTVEQKSIWLPRWGILENEMDAYEVTTTKSGLMSYAASTGHDDAVSSLLLAHAALLQYGDTDMDIKFLEDLNGKKFQDREPINSIEAFYNNIIEDQDD